MEVFTNHRRQIDDLFAFFIDPGVRRIEGLAVFGVDVSRTQCLRGNDEYSLTIKQLTGSGSL